MNRSILIIICDFLMLSLLSLARFDPTDPQATPREAAATADAAAADLDMMRMLKLALEQERLARQQLDSELTQTRQAIDTRETLLAQQQVEMRKIQGNLQQKEGEARQLAGERAGLAAQQAVTQENLQRLQELLASTSSEAQVSKERLERLEAELLLQKQVASQLEQKVTEVEQQQQATETERQRLAGQLQVAQTETRFTQGQVASLQEEVKVVRGEKDRIQQHAEKLTEGVTELARASENLTQEVRQVRPLVANTIFQDFVTNRLQTHFQGTRRGVFGAEVKRDRQSKTILVSDGAQTYAVYHVQDTPLAFTIPGVDWARMTGALRKGTATAPLDQIFFLDRDPRVVVAPVISNKVAGLKTKIYPLAQDPYRFQEAIVVGADEGYYGEVRFQIDLKTPHYVRMHRGMFDRLVGKFAPSSGDLVFTKNGELLGVMVNNQYCLLIDTFRRSAKLPMGTELPQLSTSQLLASMRGWIDRLPLALQ